VLGTDVDYSNSHVVNQGEHLVYLANLKNDDKNILRQCFDISDSRFTLQEYVDKVHDALSRKCGRTIADILVLNVRNRILEDQSPRKKKKAPPLTLDTVRMYLYEDLEEAWKYAGLYCMALSKITKNETSVYMKAAMSSNIICSIPSEFRYFPIVAISKKTEKLVCCNVYAISSIFDTIQLFFILALKDSTILSECKNCGKYFIPVSKRDEIYCSNCRKISYDTKIKEDSIRKAYRTIYKTQNARKQRNGHIRNIEDRFGNWVQFAKARLNDCINGDITLEEMKQAISSDEWLGIKTK
jgi:DNA-directed RNA polymerase subunit M/transcription elongation factor TFIIS